MEITPIATFHSPFKEKFGIPRQSGIVSALEGTIVFEPQFRNPDSVRELDEFDYIWLIWEFSANKHAATSPTVRPPRLGGNTRIGVFATRSPYRHNRLGLSAVKLERVEFNTPQGPVIHVSGADLMDGTPIYDIKPYIAYADAYPEARCGFVDKNDWQQLDVEIPDDVAQHFTPQQLEALRHTLALDPRPHYHDDPTKVYGMRFAHYNILFTVDGKKLKVIDSITQ
ncbi:MAG: tRNA (N6-threonylcarbamoyladenosine(37)-N6)-methyltransferase TrmO [Muribaculaceae bacterium]|nr:tRNA (N6-threonylcarbamoyladenosine(37)-N6)-methyltransferase TrmO [Muribaculaceae bacterium]